MTKPLASTTKTEASPVPASETSRFSQPVAESEPKSVFEANAEPAQPRMTKEQLEQEQQSRKLSYLNSSIKIKQHDTDAQIERVEAQQRQANALKQQILGKVHEAEQLLSDAPELAVEAADSVLSERCKEELQIVPKIQKEKAEAVFLENEQEKESEKTRLRSAPKAEEKDFRLMVDSMDLKFSKLHDAIKEKPAIYGFLMLCSRAYFYQDRSVGRQTQETHFQSIFLEKFYNISSVQLLKLENIKLTFLKRSRGVLVGIETKDACGEVFKIGFTGKHDKTEDFMKYYRDKLPERNHFVEFPRSAIRRLKYLFQDTFAGERG